MSCAVSLAACGGGGSNGSTLLPQSQTAGGQQHSSGHGAARHAMSGCTPDSYGYCAVHTSSSFADKVCYPAWHWGQITQYYEVYNNGNDLGQYVETTTNMGCGEDQNPVTTWSPADPAVQFDDPYLP